MMLRRSKNLLIVFVSLCLCGVPTIGQEIGVSNENVPHDVLMQLETGPFEQAYSISGRINPFYLRGDFDGDGKPDYAVLVTAKKDQTRGIAIWLSSRKQMFVLGAGTPFRINASQEKSLDWIDYWEVYGKKRVEQGVEAGPPPKLSGEAILIGKMESASGLIYWSGDSIPLLPARRLTAESRHVRECTVRTRRAADLPDRACETGFLSCGNQAKAR